MPPEEGDSSPLLDLGLAQRAKTGETVSGDMHLVQSFPEGTLVAVVDGLGHGEEAAVAAKAAVESLAARPGRSPHVLFKTCHEALQLTRGAALTLASFNHLDGTLTWLGVGNVEAVLLRADPTIAPAREYVLQHGGVVGLQMPPLRAFSVPYEPGDTLVLATDGIREGFAEGLPLEESPQELADRIMNRDRKGHDDALVLVARVRGGST